MSQLSHPPSLFTHPFVVWAVLRDRRARLVAAGPGKRRAHWDAAAWQRWADQPPAHSLVAGGRNGSSFAVTHRRTVG